MATMARPVTSHVIQGNALAIIADGILGPNHRGAVRLTALGRHDSTGDLVAGFDIDLGGRVMHGTCLIVGDRTGSLSISSLDLRGLISQADGDLIHKGWV